MDELERLIRLFESRTNAPTLSRLDMLLDMKRLRDPRIVPFLLRVLVDRQQSSEVRIEVVKQLRNGPLVANDRSAVAHSIAQVLVEGADARLRLQAALALGEFADVEGIPAALGDLALHTDEPLELRYSAFTSLERAGATPECVRVVRKLVSDETLGRAAGAC